ncbi:MAG: GNAT family N-acetyltransferase [Lachnospiraceae bacterium]|nr:GNAT family N-acetyltransferase [Lachnospiraceae bacterium]
MTLQYRKATLDDLEEIYALVSHAVDDLIRKDILQWDEIYPTKEDFRDDINRNQLYVGLTDNQIAVVYALNQESDKEYQNGNWKYPDRPYYVVHRLCVHPNFQHKGIAKHTLLHIEAELLQNDIHAIRLDAFSNNPFSLKLYDSLQYSRVGYADWRKGRFYLMEKYF